MNDLLNIALTRKRTPGHLSDRLQPDTDRRVAIRRSITDRLGPCLLLATCERIEIYVHTPHAKHPPAARSIISALTTSTGVDPDRIRRYTERRTGIGAARHLFRVAAGLESRRIGEPQILRQLRGAYRDARTHVPPGPVLDAMTRGAIHTGKRVRRDTTLTRSAGCVARQTVRRLTDQLATRQRAAATPTGPRVTLLGTGRLARDILVELTLAGIDHVTIVSTDTTRADRLRQRPTHHAAPRAHLPIAITASDALIACTACTSPLVTRDMLNRPDRPLTVIDLGVPPNVQHHVATVPTVTLTRLDDLPETGITTAVRNAVNTIIEHQLNRFARWSTARQNPPRIARRESIARLVGHARTDDNNRHLSARPTEHAA